MLGIFLKVFITTFLAIVMVATAAAAQQAGGTTTTSTTQQPTMTTTQPTTTTQTTTSTTQQPTTTTTQPTTTTQTTTSPQPATTSPNEGAFDKLSPGNQKIARALFEAQKTDATSSTTNPLTLDDIAAMKQSGKGWGQVFHEMKAQGLVQEKNLGQVVSKFTHQQRTSSPSSGTLITTGSGRTQMVGGAGKPEGAMSSSGASETGRGVSGSSNGRGATSSDSHGGPGMGMGRGIGRGK